MTQHLFDGILWASFTFFVGGLFFCVGCIETQLIYRIGDKNGFVRGERSGKQSGSIEGYVIGEKTGRDLGRVEGYEHGKRDAQPVRAKSGRFIGRRA